MNSESEKEIMNRSEREEQREILELLKREIRIVKEKFDTHSEENRTLNEENRTLNEENRTLNEENRTLNEENRNLNEENRVLNIELKDTMSRVDKIESLTDVLYVEVDTLQQKLASVEHKHSNLDEIWEKVMNLREEVRNIVWGEIAKLNVGFEDVYGMVKIVQDKSKDISDETEALIKRIENLEQRNKEKDKYLAGQKQQKSASYQEDLSFIHAKLINIDDKMHRNNLRIIGLPEEDTTKTLTTMLQEVLQENCPELLDKNIIKEIHRSPPTKNPMLSTPRHVIVTFNNFSNKQQILKASRKKMFKYGETTIRITEDYSTETKKQRREWNHIFQKAKELKLKPRMLYPSKLSLIINEEHFIFHKKEEFEEFLKGNPEMSRIFDLDLRKERQV
uniref:L1 transposable element RRM domain-containing protein n=1 Tax=Sarcophilus harrisii TaxID=9305 RepID=A0A7N4NUD2_SARHA